MKRIYLLIQNSYTGVIHVLPRPESYKINRVRKNVTPCGYYVVTESESQSNPDVTRKCKVCSKCHKALLKYNKNLIAYVSCIKLKGEVNGRATI